MTISLSVKVIIMGCDFLHLGSCSIELRLRRRTSVESFAASGLIPVLN
jgi:hypothetical protein